MSAFRILINIFKISLTSIGIHPKYAKYQTVSCMILLVLNILGHLVYLLTKNVLLKPRINTLSIILVTVYYVIYYTVIERRK